MCLHSVMFKLLASIETQLQLITEPDSSISEKDKIGWNETTVVVLSGITNLLADYLDVVSSHATFSKSWQTLLDHFKVLLDFKVLNINTAVFKALRQILSKGNLRQSTQLNFDRHALDVAWGLWSHSLPVIEADPSSKRFDNQGYLTAYISAVQEIYRLIDGYIDDKRVKRLLTLLREAVQQASAATYSADIEYLTPLQTQVLEALKMIRTDTEGIPAALVSQVAEFVGLAFEPRRLDSETEKPTYVAFAKASMALSESLIIAHSSEKDIYTSGAISESLTALAKPIVLKYAFPTITKSVSPWRQATTSSLEIMKSIIPIITRASYKDEVLRSIWSSIVTIANGIMTADCSVIPRKSNIDIAADQDFDIASFLILRDLITPSLGSPLIPDKICRRYTECLFHTSLIHAPSPSELPSQGQDLLSVLSAPRKGHTIDPEPNRRSKMAYVALETLLSLVSVPLNKSNPSTPPRSRLRPTSETIKLAQASAPYLILRCGLTLRAYIADQPLRGRMPQPLSQRRELLFILRSLVGLKCEPEAIPEVDGVESENKKHLIRLYPLLVKSVRVARGDEEVLEWIGRGLDGVGMEFGV